jgi:hypothetical protein
MEKTGEVAMEVKNLKLQELSTEELEALKAEIERLLKDRATANSKEYEFDIEITADPRKWKPYVAKLHIDQDKELQREFYDLNKTYGKHAVTIFGKIKAKEGDIIEIRRGGSWKNEYRAAYLVWNGKMVEIADHKDSKGYAKIVKYLAGEISVKDLLKEKEAEQ